MMHEQHPPVPAIPSVVLALGSSLRSKLTWLEQRFRAEIGSLYPGNLLRFRLVAQNRQLSIEALRALCDPLLTHPLWLNLQERGLAPEDERGPQLNVYAILSEEDSVGCRLLAPLHANLSQLYEGRVSLSLRLFYIGTTPQSLPALPARQPVLCFLLGPVKHLGYGTAGRQEPFEAIRLALNALLASNIAREIEGLLQPEQKGGLAFFALGASAIAVARPQMETWMRNTLLRRLTQACLIGETEGQRHADRLEIRKEVAGLFGLPSAESWGYEPDELWEKDLGRRIAGLFPQWADQILQASGIRLLETRRGQWQVAAQTEGDLYHHLRQILSALDELSLDAQATLAQDIVHLANGLRRHFAQQEHTILARWRELLGRSVSQGRGCLMRTAEIVAATEAGLNRARDILQAQRLSPFWLRNDRDIIALADILAAQMAPVRSAMERARLNFASPDLVALRLVPLVLLLGAAGADLRPGGWGLFSGLGGGLLFGVLTAGLQYHRLWREAHQGIRELCQLYEDSIGGLALSEAHNVVRHWQEAVTVAAAQLRAMVEELRILDSEATQALDELARFPRENTYLECQLSDPIHCSRIAETISLETLFGDPSSGESPTHWVVFTPAGALAAAIRGDLPTAALGPALVETVGRIVAQRGSGLIETRVEELLIAGKNGPFSAEETMESLHRRALPLWQAGGTADPEVALVALSREAAMAFHGWLQAHTGSVRLLPTLQRDRISYLRCRRLKVAVPSPEEEKQ